MVVIVMRAEVGLADKQPRAHRASIDAFGIIERPPVCSYRMEVESVKRPSRGELV